MSKKYEIYDVEAEMFNATPSFHDHIVFRLKWTANLGFGAIDFYYDTVKQEWDFDSEYMSKQFCLAVLTRWLNDVMNDEDGEIIEQPKTETQKK